MTAIASAPAVISAPAFSGVMPPMATTGTPKARADDNSDKGARTAPGFTCDA